MPADVPKIGLNRVAMLTVAPNGSRCRRAFTLVELLVVSKRKRAAFTLVELLVVIMIIGTLMALLLPAVLAGKETGRRGQCLNNMRNLAHALVHYDSSKGCLPGYSQPIRRGANQFVGIKPKTNLGRWALATVEIHDAGPISWATMLLPVLERQDLWDRVVDANAELEIRQINVFICPSDNDAMAVADVPALTYSVNTGAPDFDGHFLFDPKNSNIGDTIDNGMFLNLYEYAAAKMQPQFTRLSNIHDGAATTILLAENIHKSYEPFAAGFPSRFSWAFGTEQHLGIVWVVNARPQPGDSYVDQERINRVSDSVFSRDPVFDPNTSRFARPASNHAAGFNTAFCDGHVDFLREDIDYSVYQQLLTPNGRKCVDPRDHTAGVKLPAPPIQTFRSAPPLAENDYR